MTALKKLGAQYESDARQQVETFLNGITMYTPTLGLLYGISPDDSNSEGSWSLIAYGDKNVAELTATYERFGAAVCFDLDGIPTVIPQIGHARKLQSGVLEFKNNRLWHHA